MSKDLAYSYPLPTSRNIKRNFIFGNLCQRFSLFDFLFLYQLLLLCLNLLIEFLAGAFLSSLLHQLTLYGILQNGLLHVLRELGVKLLQLFIGGSIAVNQRKEFLNLGNDALLLVKRRQRN